MKDVGFTFSNFLGVVLIWNKKGVQYHFKIKFALLFTVSQLVQPINWRKLEDSNFEINQEKRMVQEDAPNNHDDWDPWNPENDEEEDQFPEEVGPPENNLQQCFRIWQWLFLIDSLHSTILIFDGPGCS